jgi:hypothetical protein
MTLLSSDAYKQVALKNPTFTGLQYIPTTVSWYLRPDALSLSTLFPFVNFPDAVKVIGGTQFAALSPTSSVTATMPAVAVLAIGGATTMIAPHRLIGDGEPYFGAVRFRPVLLAGAVGCLGVVTYATIWNRYLGDFLPFFLFAALLSVAMFPVWLEHRPISLRVVVLGGLAILLAWSCWVNAGLGLLNQHTLTSTQVPISQLSGFTSFRQNLHRSMTSGPSPGVTWGGPLPKVAALGSLYVNGACRSLFEWNGSAWVGIEWSAGAGHVILNVTLPTVPTSRPLPILTSGNKSSSLSMFGLQVLPRDQYDIAFFDQSFGQYIFHSIWERSAPLPIPTSRHVTVDLVIDADANPQLQSYAATINTKAVVSGRIPVHPATTYTVGALPQSLRSDPALRAIVAPTYPEQLHELPVRSTICDSLVR